MAGRVEESCSCGATFALDYNDGSALTRSDAQRQLSRWRTEHQHVEPLPIATDTTELRGD